MAVTKDTNALDTFVREVFDVSALSTDATVGARFAELTKAANDAALPIVGYTAVADIPAGTSRVVAVKLSERKEKALQPVALVIHALPTIDEINTHADGAAYLADIIDAALTARLLGYVRRSMKDGAVVFPSNVADYVETKTGGGFAASEYVVYNKLAGDVLKAVRARAAKAGQVFPITDKVMLRRCLESKAFASASFPGIKDELFVKLIAKFAELAVANDLPTEIFERWDATRDTVTIDIADDIDLDGLEL